MVKYQRKKAMADEEDDEGGAGELRSPGNYFYAPTATRLRSNPKFFLMVFLLASCTLLLLPSMLLLLLYDQKEGVASAANTMLCSSLSNGNICCDRSSVRSDICIMKGDIRTQPGSSSITMYGAAAGDAAGAAAVRREKIKPYTRKWEDSVMKTIDELDLVVRTDLAAAAGHRCDVRHDVPAVFFSTGGYTGNLYHEFNDGILPLYITSNRMNKKVVFVILEYHNWWVTKYGDVLSELSDFPAIDFSGDNRTHCFPEAVFGLRIHDELTVDPSLMGNNESIRDFRGLLDRAYRPRIRGLIEDEEREARSMARPNFDGSKITPRPVQGPARPKLTIMSRNGSRAIANEDLLVKMATGLGFRVEVLRPERTTELAKIYRALNSTDVMVGVHGAAMTHFLFMRALSVFIQVVPLGTEWAAETYYGGPARKFGLKYMGYKIIPKESSLYDQYDKNDPILRDPHSVSSRGWEFTKKIYLDDQTINLNLKRFKKRLIRAYDYSRRREST
ncbi:xylan glycosyltransferase MUCI21-like [Andrographis paniculata]|uniref:xylan glycosyltransferase MUCI21-like n=1 Tax=Andrographis paniculata TaxID=175694 RepID=UPI0021E8D3B5|nr:xylan glycosyltransferase MUCI21-like [Andrographis paniculata]